MTIVVDANILISVGISDEPLHTQAEQIVQMWRASNINLAAPRLFRSEITAVVRKAVFLDRITHEYGRIFLSEFLAYPITFYDDDALLTSAYELANRFNRPRAYDAQYLALAARLACEFWTADERLYNAVRDGFAGIRWLGHWRVEGT